MNKPLKAARCVKCQRRFDQEDATHYPEDVPVNNRWTCSVACQRKLQKDAEKKKRQEELLSEFNMDNPAAALGLETDAAKAKKVLNETKAPALAADPEGEEFALLHGDTPSPSLLLAAGEVAKAASYLAPKDQAIMAGIVIEMLNTVLEKANDSSSDAADRDV